DAVDRPTSQRDFDLNASTPLYTATTAYDDSLLTETSVDRGGITTVREKDGMGRVERTRRSKGTDSQSDLSDFDGNSQVRMATDTNGPQTLSIRDGANRLRLQTRGYGTSDATSTRSTYDAVGNLRTSKSDRVTGVPYDVLNSYDDLNHLVRTEDANHNVTVRA